MIALAVALTPQQEQDLVQRFMMYVLDFKMPEIESSIIDRDIINMHEKFPALPQFNHHYIMVPTDKSPWYSIEEKARFVIDIMSNFHNNIAMPVCVFPLNGTVIENIPGGSDSEKFCWLMQRGDVTRIVYKKRREKW